jgi:hypothetical protein
MCGRFLSEMGREKDNVGECDRYTWVFVHTHDFIV